ncbi:flagellar biosynthetic protein FliR [Tautonia marina]|uniref:flagellar biosynthetic protein FliR n=1 Tax=Tautonia marina TaxID=2653855 RepID=UPI001260F74B|nr:flagellar biosynthetic protein FliR [Tautonia marina]
MPDLLHEMIGAPSSFVLVLARSAGLVWGLAWLAGASGAGLRTKLAAAVVIASAVVPIVGPRIAPPDDSLALGGSVLIEVALGAALGVGAGLIVAAARLAGEVIGAQAGLSAASSLTPGSGEGMETPLATLFGLIALAAFAAIDGPIRLTIALADSYGLGLAPEGVAASLAGGISTDVVRSVFQTIGQALGLALWLAAPVALSLLVAQIAVGVLVRGAPALSSFTTWLSVRATLGLILLMIGLASVVSGLASAWLTLLPGGF